MDRDPLVDYRGVGRGALVGYRVSVGGGALSAFAPTGESGSGGFWFSMALAMHQEWSIMHRLLYTSLTVS